MNALAIAPANMPPSNKAEKKIVFAFRVLLRTVVIADKASRLLAAR